MTTEDGRRNPRSTVATKVPGIPKVPTKISAELRQYLTSLGEALEIRLGRKGDPRDRAVTLRELTDGGLSGVNLRVGTVTTTGPQDDPNADFPVAPVGFIVTGGFSYISLRWNWPGQSYSGHSLTEIWRNTVDDRTEAGGNQRIGISPGTTFIDRVGSDASFYYWIRHVNVNGQEGPFNATAGTLGQTQPDTTYLTGLLAGAITSTELATALSSSIADIPDIKTLVDNWEVTIPQIEDMLGFDATVTYTGDSIKQRIIDAEGNISTLTTDVYDSNGTLKLVTSSTYNAEIFDANGVSRLSGLESELYNSDGTLKLVSSAVFSAVEAEVFPDGTSSASALDTLNSTIYNSDGTPKVDSTVVDQLTTEVFPDGTSSASAIDGLNSTIYDANGNPKVDSTVVDQLTTEVYPDGTSSASAIAGLNSTIYDANGNPKVDSTVVDQLTTEVFPDGTSSASAIDGLNSTIYDANGNPKVDSTVVDLLKTEVFPDGTSSASAIDGLNSTIYDANGNPKVDSTIFNQMKTEVYPDGTTSASAIENLSSGYDDPDGGTSSVTLQQAMDTQVTLNGTLKGQYTLKIDAAGTIAGFGLANTSSASGNATSEFLIQADKFALLPPSTVATSFPTTGNYQNRTIYRSDLDETYYYSVTANNNAGGWVTTPDSLPFIVTTTPTTLQGETVPAGVYIDTAYMNKGRVLDLVAGSVVADYISATVAMDAPYLFGGTINVGQINKPTTDPRTWTVSGNTRVSNFSVDALGVMHANSAVMEGITIKAPDGTVLVDAGGMTGSSGGNLAYNANFRRGDLTFNSATSTWTEDVYLVDGFVEYNPNTNPTVSTFRKDLGYIRCGDNGSGDPVNNTKVPSYIRSNKQRFPVVPGETLYLYAQTSTLTGLWMAVAYYDNSDGTTTSGFVTPQGAVSTSNSDFDSKSITAGGNSRQFSIAAVTVPASAQYGEIRFGSNTGDYVYFYNVGVSRTPPELTPKYAATYIRDLSVDTLQIAGNAVTLADSSTTGPVNTGSSYTTHTLETGLMPENSSFVWFINAIVNQVSGNPSTYDLVVKFYTKTATGSYVLNSTDTIWIYAYGLDARILKKSFPASHVGDGYMKCEVRLQQHNSSSLVSSGSIEIAYVGAKK
jgi:hypothetical protein